MSTIPKPIKKRFYKRWWFWFLIVVVVFSILGGTFGAQSYTTAQLESYAYLKEEVVAQKRDIKKTVSTNGVIVAGETVAAETATPANLQALLAAAPIDTETVDVNDILASLDTETLEQLMGTTKETTTMEFFASDSEVIDLDVGQKAVITIPSYEDGKEEFTGRVSAVSRTKEIPNAAGVLTGASGDTGYRIRVTSKQIPKRVKNLIGLNVDIVIEIEEKNDVLTLEPGAVQYDEEDAPFVYLLPTIDEVFVKKATETEDITELLEKKYISVGFQGDDAIEVTDGLREGDAVLLYVPTQGAASPFGF